jgi:tetratricopeptide (TPR) repeat protein
MRWLVFWAVSGVIGAASIASLEQAWKDDPANYAKGYNLALAYLESGASEKSRSVIEALLKRADKGELHNLLGEVEEREGHVNAAAKQYEIAARLDPSEQNLFDLGSDLLKHRGFAPALKVFEFGSGRYPNSARLRVGLGVAYYSLGQYDHAVQALCEAVDLDPKDVKALDFLGKMYNISPQYAGEVAKRLKHFAQTYPDNSAANYYYALSLRDAKRDGVEKYLIKASELKPAFAAAHYELGVLYEEESRDSEATHQFELAVRYAPDLRKAHYHLARMYQKAGQEALSQKEFQAVKALKGDE